MYADGGPGPPAQLTEPTLGGSVLESPHEVPLSFLRMPPLTAEMPLLGT